MPLAATPLSMPDRPAIHPTNAWNPVGVTLRPIEGTRLYFAHTDHLAGPCTVVFLGSQRHLTFVAELEGHQPADVLRDAALDQAGLYPHLVDLGPSAGSGAVWPRLPSGTDPP